MVPVHPAMAISPAVLRATAHWKLSLDAPHIRCLPCGQSVMQARSPWTLDELSGPLLAHLMQAHAWTRETVPGDDAA
jgi:hypothetical protein